MPDLRPIANPPNPFESRHVEWEGEPPSVELSVYEERGKTILTENASPDVGFRFGLNPYRGCFHGCVYCYARPSHQYWGFGAGTDFERKIIVKIDAPELLARELARGRAKGESIAFSGNTDCYQPLEASYELTRRCLEVCLARRQAVGIITKGTVIRRDIALIAELHESAGAYVHVSIAFADEAMRRAFDPFAPPIDARFETMKRIADAGVPVGLALAPVIPGVNDAMIPTLLERAAQAGARSAFMSLLRLPREVRDVFDVELERLLPDRAKKVKRTLASMRGGRLNDVRFGERMRGSGARWDAIEQLFELHVRRLGLNERQLDEREPRGQLSLF